MQQETPTVVSSGARTRPPFRADHVGSLLRPPQLLTARDEFANGRIDAAGLRAVEDDAIREIVRKQEEIGLRSATDGEFRRESWHMDFIYQLDGITKEAGHIAVKFHNEQGDIEFTPAALHIDGKLGVSKTIFGDAFQFLQQTVNANVPAAVGVPTRAPPASRLSPGGAVPAPIAQEYGASPPVAVTGAAL